MKLIENFFISSNRFPLLPFGPKTHRSTDAYRCHFHGLLHWLPSISNSVSPHTTSPVAIPNFVRSCQLDVFIAGITGSIPCGCRYFGFLSTYPSHLILSQFVTQKSHSATRSLERIFTINNVYLSNISLVEMYKLICNRSILLLLLNSYRSCFLELTVKCFRLPVAGCCGSPECKLRSWLG